MVTKGSKRIRMSQYKAIHCHRTVHLQFFIIILLCVNDSALTFTNLSFSRRNENSFLNRNGNGKSIQNRRCLAWNNRFKKFNRSQKGWNLCDQEGVGATNTLINEGTEKKEKDRKHPSLAHEDEEKCNTLPRLYVGTSHPFHPDEELTPKLFQSARVRLSADQTHYLTNVMRFFKKRKRNNIVPSLKNSVNIAEETIDLSHCVRLFDGVNGEWLVKIIDPTMTPTWNPATIKKSNNRKASLSNTSLEAECLIQLKGQSNNSTKLSQTWVVFAPIKKQRMKLLVEKCTELGADVFCPVITDHTDSIDDVGPKEIEKLSLVACEATEQSERLSVPKFVKSIQDVETNGSNTSTGQYLNLKELLEIFVLAASHKHSAILVCRERNDQTLPILEAYSNVHKNACEICLILVGPEGGWSEKENILLDEFGVKYPNKIIGVSLGSQVVLRAETAAITAVASHALWTDSLRHSS